MNDLSLSQAIEELMVSRNLRNMQVARAALPPDYYLRAARQLRDSHGVVIIGTGFPVTDTFETDGPVGAIALYNALQSLGAQPVIACGPPLSDAIAADYRVLHLRARDLASAQEEAAAQLRRLQPAAVISIERPGLAEDGRGIRAAWGAQRPVLVAGSTHEREEAVILDAFRGVLAAFPDALLVLVPRHPERFARAAQAARTGGLEVALHSAGATSSAGAQCFVVDAMGELLRYYAAGDVAFVGGSLEPVGGHNVLEPAALGRPVLVGPHTFNFSDITAQLIDAGAAARVADGAALQAAIVELFGDAHRRQRMGAAARQLVASGQGALARTLDEIERLSTAATG